MATTRSPPFSAAAIATLRSWARDKRSKPNIFLVSTGQNIFTSTWTNIFGSTWQNIFVSTWQIFLSQPTSFKLTTLCAGEDLVDPPELKNTRRTRIQRTMAMPRGLIRIEPPRFILGNQSLSSTESSKGSVTAMVQSFHLLCSAVKEQSLVQTTCSSNLTPDLCLSPAPDTCHN